MVVFKTKNGVKLEYSDGTLTSTDMEAVKDALLEDCNSNDILASSMAQDLLDLLKL